MTHIQTRHTINTSWAAPNIGDRCHHSATQSGTTIVNAIEMLSSHTLSIMGQLVHTQEQICQLGQ